MKIESMISRDVRKLYMNSVVYSAKIYNNETMRKDFLDYTRNYNSGENFALRTVIYAMNVLTPATWYSMVLDYQTAVLATLSRKDITEPIRAFYNGMFTGLLNVQDIIDSYDII